MVSVVSLPEIFIRQRIFYDVVQLGFCGTIAKVSYENWAPQTSIERVSTLTSRPSFLSWIVGVSVCSPPCPWYTPHSVGPSLFPILRDVLPMCFQRPYHPAKVLHLVHPSRSPQSSLVLIIKAINHPSAHGYTFELAPFPPLSFQEPTHAFTPAPISLSGFHSPPLPALTVFILQSPIQEAT